MAIDKAQTSLNFSGGIHEVSFLDRQKDFPQLPQAKRIIYFNEDAAPSNLSRLFRGFNGNQLVDKVCRPNRKEHEAVQAGFAGRQAIAAFNWIESLEDKIDPELKGKVEDIFKEFVENELKEQVQRNLLKQV